MFYNNQYTEGDLSLLGDPMAAHRGENYGFNQTGEFGRGEGSFPGNPYNFDNYDDRGSFGDDLQSSGYILPAGNYDDLAYGAGSDLQSPALHGPEDVDYYRQAGLPEVGMAYSQPGFDQQNYAYGSEVNEGGYESRRDGFKDPDRERDRDRCVL